MTLLTRKANQNNQRQTQLWSVNLCESQPRGRVLIAFGAKVLWGTLHLQGCRGPPNCLTVQIILKQEREKERSVIYSLAFVAEWSCARPTRKCWQSFLSINPDYDNEIQCNVVKRNFLSKLDQSFRIAKVQHTRIGTALAALPKYVHAACSLARRIHKHCSIEIRWIDRGLLLIFARHSTLSQSSLEHSAATIEGA